MQSKVNENEIDLLKTILRDGGPFKIERMSGLTNFVYRVTSSQNTVIYRVYSRNYETLLQKELSNRGFAPKIFYADSEKRIEEFLTYDSVGAETIKQDFRQIAKLLATSIQKAANGKSRGLAKDATLDLKYLNRDYDIQYINDLRTMYWAGRKTIIFRQTFHQDVQKSIMKLFSEDCLQSLEHVLAHNDLNPTNFLKDKSGKYHLIDWENAGLNYPGYEIANFLKELTWDYTYNQKPYFRIQEECGLTQEEVNEFVRYYWRSFTSNEDAEAPPQLYEQIQIGKIFQNYYWLLVGFLSLQFKKEEMSIDLVEYIKIRFQTLCKDLTDYSMKS